MSDSNWRPLGGVDPRALSAARLQAHYAVQWLARAARAYIPAKPDDSHTNLRSNDALEGFTTHPVMHDARLGVSISTLTLAVVDADDRTHASLPLPGRTDRDARAWLSEQVAAASLDPAALDAALPYEMPAHPIADGAAYESGNLTEALTELAAWFANASGSLNWIKADQAARGMAVSPVRCWPHHFDIATLISLEGGDPEHARSVNAGLSPGDGSYDEPYFFVSPWPYPDASKLLPLPAVGHWHTQDFLAAVAPASRIAAATDQQQAAQEFLQAAVATAIAALA